MPLTVQSDTEHALRKLLARAGISTADVQSRRLDDIDEVLEFVCDAPPSTFIGFGGQQILHTNLVLYSTDDPHVHRIERCGRWLVHCEIERTGYDGTYRLAGQAILAEVGSTRERAFLLAALKGIANDAAQPLRNMRVNAEQAGLPIDAAIDKAIAGMSALALGHRETATMRAALEFWQREGQGSSGHEHDIAAAGGSLQPLGADEIAQLVARLAGSAEAGPIDKASDSEVNRARRLYANDNVQIDDGARASRGDGITWVEAWVALEEQCHE